MKFTFEVYKRSLARRAIAIDTLQGIQFIPAKFPHEFHNRCFVTIDIPEWYLSKRAGDLMEFQSYAIDSFKRIKSLT
jgi:hypothetical protein